MGAGEVLELRWGDVLLDSGQEALRIREAKNGVERTIILGPNRYPTLGAQPSCGATNTWASGRRP